MKLAVVAQKQDPDVIVYLEEILARARTGEITGVMIMAQDGKGVAFRHAGLKDRFELLGWLSHTMHNLQTDAP